MGDGVMAAVQGFVSGAWWWSDLRTGSPDHAVVAALSSQLVSAGTETSMPLHYQREGFPRGHEREHNVATQRCMPKWDPTLLLCPEELLYAIFMRERGRGMM
ncbi:hypothetical protein EOD39_21384 [Acipenser ruthenus]|uniref:Uncharacterized protein n=1 Tax=Acipenser ruthenus TaxID=7906 RepID=A0A444USV5_ACIRT|nr:hypothetical protein EOD39_21384 [Acipenser ruthenus]